ncbi:Codeine O-demethylase [Sesamum angolense]|uniref:Codeine O-demethylase n=1 Tax=Sesamum angolense TaxID=2727404 RepID=A0AAE2BVG0_9LAMI|nr:Codeine O-demethylase [Sesamum angolense]
MELSVQEMVKKPVHGIPKCYLVDPEPALVNHGVETSLVEKLKYEIQEFYKLPLEERLRYKIRPGDVEGYGQTVILTADQKVDWADRFYMFTNPIHNRKPHLLPELPSSLRETLEAYILELQKLSRALFGLIAEALKIDRTEIEEMFEDGLQSIRVNYYPPCPEPNKVNGLTPHSDATGITILLQLNGVDGFQILSNGLYKSIEHRAAVNSEKERITIAMFFNPKLKAQIGPSPSLLLKQPPLYKSMITEHYVKDFFSRKLNSKSFLDYMKL